MMLSFIGGLFLIGAIAGAVALFIMWNDTITQTDPEYNQLFMSNPNTPQLQVEATQINQPESLVIELVEKKENILYEKIFNKNFGFGIKVLRATNKPQTAVYLAMHQCYSIDPVNEPIRINEEDAGGIIVKRLLEGDKGHFSPTEQACVTIGLEGINHGTLQQLLRSRIGVSPSLQSFRYTSLHILDAGVGKRKIEDVIYLRPVGKYHDREQAYEYTAESRMEDLSCADYMVKHVCKRLNEGMPPEQARGILPFDYRQHAVITFNARSLMAVLDRRSKKDAQVEIQILADMLMEVFTLWMPEVADWYRKHRYGKARLAP